MCSIITNSGTELQSPITNYQSAIEEWEKHTGLKSSVVDWWESHCQEICWGKVMVGVRILKKMGTEIEARLGEKEKKKKAKEEMEKRGRERKSKTLGEKWSAMEKRRERKMEVGDNKGMEKRKEGRENLWIGQRLRARKEEVQEEETVKLMGNKTGMR